MNKDLMGLIVKREDGSEIVNYDDPGFPSYIYDGWIKPHVTWEKVPHFHEDIELLSVKSGRMAYSVNGDVITLEAGDTIFVNSNQIHYSLSLDGGTAKYVIFVIHPSVLMSSVAVEMQAIRPIIDNPDISYLRFRGINEYTDEVYKLMMELPDIRHDAFQVTIHFFKLWEIIKKQAGHYFSSAEESSADPRMQMLKSMMHYVSQNYKANMTLADIAASANISKSLCNAVFNRYLGESPINYLMHFRCRKVAEYLRSGSMPLSEIASLTGFNGVSYMSETFRKFFDASPREYRKMTPSPEPPSAGRRINTVIFDMDGTVLDTLEDLTISVNHVLREFGMPERTLEEYRLFFGNGIRHALELAVPAGTPAETIDRMLPVFREHYDAHCLDHTKPYDGIIDLIKSLKDKGYRLAIVSNKIDSAVKELNDMFFSKYVSVAIGEQAGVRRKPAPDTVLAALEELGSSKKEAIYIGDSEVDLKTAENSGLPAISVLWGFRSRDFLTENGAIYFAEKPEEIIDILSELSM